MPFPDSFLQELKLRSDIVDIVSSYVTLRRAGRNLVGLCPFHGEKTPSFNVYPDNGSFYCFGCHVGGDVISFVKKIENLDYLEAVRFLADRAGMQMPENRADDGMAAQRRRMLELNRETARYYHAALNSDVGREGMEYLRGRALTLKTIRHFGLGFAPPGRFALVNHLRKKGFTDEEAIRANVAFRGRNGGAVDRFFNRVMFPIIDILGIVIAFYLIVQILSAAGLLTNSFKGQLVPICAYVILAISLNLTVGILGELSLGHAGFMSVGAFSGTLVWVTMSPTTPQPLALLLAFVVGGVVAGIFGFLVGVPVLRLSGDYLAIVTLAFGEIVKNVMNACYLGLDANGLHFSLKDAGSLGMEADGKVLINGAMGITGISKASNFTIGTVLVILTLLVILNLVHSRAGRAMTSIRDNEIAARSVGIPITKYKLMAFVTSAVFAGIAGVLYSLNYSSLVAKKFDYNTSILILVFVVLGGIGNLRGSVIAAAVLTVLPEMLRSMNDYRMLIYAIVLIVVMIFNQSPQMIELRSKLTARWRKGGKDETKKKGVA